MARTIAVFTGNRAEYGLQQPVLAAIDAHPSLEYQLIVAGAHLEPDFGRTLCEIKADGFVVHAEVKADLPQDTLAATPRAIGAGIIGMCDVLESLAPDILVVPADRFEGFAPMVAATQMGIPTAHIEGGDLTEGGALDDNIRHAMTKLAHLHFTTNQQASNRVLAMGEEPWRVHQVGLPALEGIKQGRYAKPDALAKTYGIDPQEPVVLFTQHSVATEFDESAAQVAPALAALTRLASEGVQVIMTYPNNDAGGRAIMAAMEDAAADAPATLQLHRSLGRHNYHGLLALALDAKRRVACVGNSSSGIKETPVVGCPTVNIGSRQRGRLRAANVIDAGYDEDEIYRAIRRCFDDGEFRERCRTTENPYGSGDSGRRIAEVLATVPLDRALIQKKMTLRGEVRDGWYR